MKRSESLTKNVQVEQLPESATIQHSIEAACTLCFLAIRDPGRTGLLAFRRRPRPPCELSPTLTQQADSHPVTSLSLHAPAFKTLPQRADSDPIESPRASCATSQRSRTTSRLVSYCKPLASRASSQDSHAASRLASVPVRPNAQEARCVHPVRRAPPGRLPGAWKDGAPDFSERRASSNSLRASRSFLARPASAPTNIRTKGREKSFALPRNDLKSPTNIRAKAREKDRTQATLTARLVRTCRNYGTALDASADAARIARVRRYRNYGTASDDEPGWRTRARALET